MTVDVTAQHPRIGATGGWDAPAPPQQTTTNNPAGYNYPPSLATTDTADLAAVEPRLRKSFEEAKQSFEGSNPQYKLVVTSTARTRDKQAKIFKESKGKYTTIDGSNTLSRHNYAEALAIDAAIIDKRTGKPVDPNSKLGKQLYDAFGLEVEKKKLVWGGRWKAPYDPYHVQLDEPAPLSKNKPMDSAVEKFTRLSRGALN